MTQRASAEIPEATKSNPRLAILLAMAMFVLVVDTSLMNVSISAVVHDIGTTVSGVVWLAPSRHSDTDQNVGVVPSVYGAVNWSNLATSPRVASANAAADASGV